MTDDPRGDPVPVVADALARHIAETITTPDGVTYACPCGKWRSLDLECSFTRHRAEAIVERLYGEGLLAYGVGKREET